MTSLRIKNSIKAKMKEHRVSVFNEGNITNVLKDTVRATMLIKIALEMSNKGEFNEY